MGRICIKKDATSYFLPATQKTLFRKYGDTVNLMKKYFSRRTSKSRNSSGKKFRYGRFFRNTGPGLKAEGMSRHVPYLSLIWTGQWLIVLHWCLIFYFNRFLFVISVYFIFFDKKQSIISSASTYWVNPRYFDQYRSRGGGTGNFSADPRNSLSRAGLWMGWSEPYSSFTVIFI